MTKKIIFLYLNLLAVESWLSWWKRERETDRQTDRETDRQWQMNGRNYGLTDR